MFRPTLPSPSMVVALVALVIAAGGVAVAAIPGSDGALHACVADGAQIGVGSPLTPYAVPKGNLRVIDSDASCGTGETPLIIDAPPEPVTEDAPVVFASRSKAAKHVSDKLTAITSNAVPEGQYLVTGSVRVSHPGGLEADQRVKCALLGPDRKVLPASTANATFEKGADAGDVTIPISTVVDHAAAGMMTLACEEDPLPGGDGASRGAARAAQAAVGSPGVLSGNLAQVPVQVPVNVCGNTVNVIGLLNPAFGNTCVNG
jgi:hypothetical protein